MRVLPSVALEALRAALLRLDLRLRLTVDAMREDLAERVRDPFHGLYISESDVDAMLASTPPGEAARRLLAEAPCQVLPRLHRLAQLFGLDAFEQEVVLICIAPEVDLRYERLYAYLQDDVTRRRPTVDLALRLLCSSLEDRIEARSTFSPEARLFRFGLLGFSDDSAAKGALLSRPLRVDDRIVEYLLGSDQPDSRLSPFAELVPPVEDGREAGLPPELTSGLVRLFRAGTEALTSERPVAYLYGPPGTAKLATARTICGLAQVPMLAVDLALLMIAGRAEALLPLAMREALLSGSVLCLDGMDRVLSDEPDVLSLRASVRRLLGEHQVPALLLGESRWEPATWLPEATALRVELRAPEVGARLALWRQHLAGELSAEDTTAMAERYRLDVHSIRSVVSAARSRAVCRSDGPAALEDFRSAARAIASPPLDGLALRLEPRYGWDDIVLPQDSLAQLRELCERARHQGTVLGQWGFGRKHARRRGLTGLFVGQPGTGKSMAAEIVAGDLGLDLYRIDLSAVVSKYIGETEKNLERIFRAADQGDSLLLFDEADALFGKRSDVRDAHDRYANVEVAYLLQRLETYEGIAILTSNLRGNIDEAFMRRLDYVLEFPMPEEAERLAIWRRAIPSEAPLAPDVDVVFLARKFKLAGGHIRNIALAAAFLAAADGGPIAMRHLVWGTRREHQKLGKLLAEADFETYCDLLKTGGMRENGRNSDA